MRKLSFSTTIDAPRETVWDLMLAPDSYRIWTAPFAEGSYYEGSWDKGQRIRFLTPTGDGMFATVAENRPYEFLSIRHEGMIQGGIDQPASGKWSDARENYTLTPAAGGTEVRIEMDVEPEYEQFMQGTWPEALAKLKEICEAPE